MKKRRAKGTGRRAQSTNSMESQDCMTARPQDIKII